MRIEWIDDEASLAELETRWDALADEAGVPFARPAWLLPWWRAFGRGRLAVVTAWDADELVALLPLESHDRRLRALANEQTPIFRPLGTPDAVARSVRAALARADVLELPALTAGRDESEAIVATARGERRVVASGTVQRQPVVVTTGSWDAYRDGLHRGTRKDIERRRRRLEDELAPVFRVLEAPGDLDRQLALGFAAEAAGWKGERGTAILNDPRLERFYRETAAAFADLGKLALSAVEVDGGYAAFDLCIVDGGRVWVPKGGFDERYRRFAPGLVLTLAEIEATFAGGHDAFELLGEPVPWKLRFANDSRPQVFVGAYRRRPGALARYGYRRARPLLRGAYRRLPGRAAR